MIKNSVTKIIFWVLVSILIGVGIYIAYTHKLNRKSAEEVVLKTPAVLDLPNDGKVPGEVVLSSSLAPAPVSVKDKTSTKNNTVISDPIITSQPSVEEKPTQPSWDELDKKVREVLVNVFCTNVLSEKPETGSGVIIDPRGVILTNAHVAIDMLLKKHISEGNVECVIRTGDPARPTYQASLLYISPGWVTSNASYVVWEEPANLKVGNDHAIILITSATGGGDLPSSFPYVPLHTTSTFTKGEKFLLAGYPAELLSNESKKNNLRIVTSVEDLDFTDLSDNKANSIGFSGSPLAYWGASGGPVVQNEGKLAGVITLGEKIDNQPTNVYAFIVSDFLKTFEQENGQTLASYLSGNLDEVAEDFEKTKGQELEKILNKVIEEYLR